MKLSEENFRELLANAGTICETFLNRAVQLIANTMQITCQL
jgi:hypothetical protein